MVPATVPSKAAVARVRTAVEAMPGAGWISVEWCGDAPGESRWLRVFPAGDGREQWDGVWEGVWERIATAVRDALAADADA